MEGVEVDWAGSMAGTNEVCEGQGEEDGKGGVERDDRGGEGEGDGD